MNRIGIIDVGTMAIRLVIYELLSDKTFKIIEDIKENVALGEYALKEGMITGEKISEGANTIYIYHELCKRYGVRDTRCLISSTFSYCENLKELVDSISRKSSIVPEVLEERVEAEASFSGVINNIDVEDALLVDMGGNTTKLIHIERRKIKNWHTMKVGGAAIASSYKVLNRLEYTEEVVIRDMLRRKLGGVEWLPEVKGLPVIGVGGVMRNLAKIHTYMCEYPLNILHNYHLKIDDMEEVLDFIKKKTYDEKLKIEGLAKSRAYSIAGSFLIMDEVMKLCQSESIVVSGNGMREGMIYMNNLKVDSSESVFEGSLNEVMNKFNLSKEDGENTYRVFKKIYDKIQCKHNIEIKDEKILKTACYLGRAGVNINFYDHPLHSLYMILYSGLRGISHRDLVVAALIVSQQTKFNDNYKKFKALLGKKEIKCIKKLSVILRVSKLLKENFLVENNEFSIDICDKKVVLRVKKSNLLDAQISRILMSGDRFRELFNKELVVCTE